MGHAALESQEDVTMPDETKRLYDVVIYEIATRKVDTIAGKDLPESGSFHTVGKRLETVLPRLNEYYSCRSVEAGKYQVGDVLPPRG